ncbi:hypothetical protein M3Y99_01656900 [Aphelenchoides fujianensis]|nr:hypothetical protein M3Y99_01656900 [Aphelenchoides fujianensis]
MAAALRQSGGILRSLRVPARPLRFYSEQPPEKPSKETLLATDWAVEGLMPSFFKANMGAFFKRMTRDVEFEDRVFGYNLKGTSALNVHLLKIRTYFHYKSPYNKLEYLGSIVYEDYEVLTILWRLKSLKSSFLRYFPAFVTGKQQEYRTWEGALDLHIRPDGKIFKMVNRPATDGDRQASGKFGELKRQAAEEVERKEAEIADSAARKIGEQ